METYLSSQTEETELVELPVDGELPAWLRGKLVRNGPALFEAGEHELRHWFDGFGMLHGFTIEAGSVYYQSKFIRSPEYLHDRETGRVSVVTWGTASDPCRSIFRRFFANFTAPVSNTPVAVTKIGDRYYATSDIATLNEFDLAELDTLSTVSTAKQGVMAAHPAYLGGRVWNRVGRIGPVVRNEIVSLDESATPQRHHLYTGKRLDYFHSFGFTDRYFVTIEQPLYLSFPQLMGSGVTKKSFYECFAWDATATNVFHVYDRHMDAMRSIPSDLRFFYFHTVNTFVDGDEIVIDVCAYDDSGIIDDFYRHAMATDGIPADHRPTLRRLRVNLADATVDSTDLGLSLELPALNHAYGGKPYRYAYGVQEHGDSPRLADQVVKYDFDTGTTTVWHDPELIPGEPIFVAAGADTANGSGAAAGPGAVGGPGDATGPGAAPQTHAAREDDGVLLVVCHDVDRGVACLVVLDATDLSERARCTAPRHIPISLHGAFYDLPA